MAGDGLLKDSGEEELPLEEQTAGEQHGVGGRHLNRLKGKPEEM